MQHDQCPESSLELQTLLECNKELTNAFSSDLINVSGTLLARGFIAGQTDSEMRIMFHTNDFRASQLAEAIRKKIELDPNKFKEFLEVLREMGSTQYVAEILSSKYSQLNNAINTCTTVGNTAAVDHDRKQLLQATYAIAIALVVIALVVIQCAQNIVVTIVIGIAIITILLAVFEANAGHGRILDTVINYFDFLATLFGRTLGNFIPFKCPHCGEWSRVSSYGPGSVVKGPLNCPDCDREIFGRACALGHTDKLLVSEKD